jgi:hypothetical protein
MMGNALGACWRSVLAAAAAGAIGLLPAQSGAQPLAPAPSAPEAAPSAPTPAPVPRRALRLSPSFQYLFSRAFDGVSQAGTGVFTVYEFILSPKFNLGINLSYRIFPGKERLQQIGYGLLLKHYLAGTAPGAAVSPFFEYGLLLQSSRISTRPGAATSHDTRLSVGSDFKLFGRVLFVEASYHYSRAGFFELPAVKLDNFELELGWRARF